MKVAHGTFLVLCSLCAGVACATAVAQAPTRANREVVFEKAAIGYRARVPTSSA